uniref:Reverse transcriptase domain-containing protein n=1 Tax=Trichuris muris TaxID=70415 RepID=A0A5S6QC38_TRIMR
MDIVKAHEQYRMLKPPKDTGAPRAVLTSFGWPVLGLLPALDFPPNRFAVCHGVRKTYREAFSPDHERALSSLKSSTRKINGYYECGMLWKKREMKLMAAWRWPKPGSPVCCVNFAETQALLRSTSNRHCWYLLRHAVKGQNKQGKLRVVFDASARTNGLSLNDILLTRPAMLTNLFSLLIRFGEYPTAVSADIAKMVHQVLVPERDQSMLRFLWREQGSPKPMEQFQMTLHIFGAVCSPATCTYALRRTAQDHQLQFLSVWQKVVDNFYMDNHLDSFLSEKLYRLASYLFKLYHLAIS